MPLLMVLQNYQNYRNDLKRVLFFALIQLNYKIKEHTQYSKKKEFPIKKKEFPNEKKEFTQYSKKKNFLIKKKNFQVKKKEKKKKIISSFPSIIPY